MPWGTQVTPHSARPWAPSGLDFLPPADIDLFFPASNEDNKQLGAKHRSRTTWVFPTPSLHHMGPVVFLLPAFNSHLSGAWLSLA